MLSSNAKSEPTLWVKEPRIRVFSNTRDNSGVNERQASTTLGVLIEGNRLRAESASRRKRLVITWALAFIILSWLVVPLAVKWFYAHNS